MPNYCQSAFDKRVILSNCIRWNIIRLTHFWSKGFGQYVSVNVNVFLLNLVRSLHFSDLTQLYSLHFYLLTLLSTLLDLLPSFSCMSRCLTCTIRWFLLYILLYSSCTSELTGLFLRVGTSCIYPITLISSGQSPFFVHFV